MFLKVDVNVVNYDVVVVVGGDLVVVVDLMVDALAVAHTKG